MHTTGRPGPRARRRLSAVATSGAGRGGQRHPLVAVAMVLPMAALFAVAFGGAEAVLAQASSVAGMLAR